MSHDSSLAAVIDHSRATGVKPTTVSRRSLFAGSAAALGSFWGAPRAAKAKGSPPEVAADVDPGSVLAKLVRRTTFGITQEELGTAATSGYEGYLERQLNPAAIDDSALESMLAPLSTLGMLAYELAAADAGQIRSELIQAVLRRAIFSRRQLHERMVELWTDHFNIDISDGDFAYLKAVDDREVIRPNAMGTFPALLSASAHSPAMLRYLDNVISVAGNPNENYARELMELHTLGVDGGYTQADVVEVARCFTGWTYYGRGNGTLIGTFRYRDNQHDQGVKTVLGHTIPANGGMQDGVTVLNILAGYPSTARFIATKLCKRLVAENPSASLISEVAATYTATGGDIKAMIRTALRPNVVADAALKYKRPFHVAASALRALPITVTSTNSLRSKLAEAGQQPYYWNPPDGYPDTFAHWSGLLLPRWNLGSSLMANQISGITVDYAGFYAGATTADQMVDRIDGALYLGEMPASERTRIRDYMLPNPPSTNRQRDGVALAIASPTFQWF